MEEEDQFQALSFFSALILFTPVSSQVSTTACDARPGNVHCMGLQNFGLKYTDITAG